MEFTFDVNEVLQEPITKITSQMIPPGFVGDRRKLWEAQSKLTDIVNVMGEASAAAQGLNKPITTADRLKNSEHTLYLLTDPKGQKGKGAVLGLLKMGRKALYIFDRDGQHHQLKPLCVLDFYVHENMQRMGLGNKIFQYMLQEENIEPIRLAIDRPSEKFLGFLKKHYNLTGPVPQMNNFVVFDGFFARQTPVGTPDHQKFQLAAENNNSYAANVSPTKSQNGYHNTPFGRYGAPRPPCSMGQIIHNHSSTVQSTEPSSEPQMQPPVHQSPKLERPRSLSLHTSDEPEIEIKEDEKSKIDETSEETETDADNLHADIENLTLTETTVPSLGAEAALSSKVKISERENNIIPADIPAEYTPRTPSNLTEQGFLDLKFYHSRLW